MELVAPAAINLIHINPATNEIIVGGKTESPLVSIIRQRRWFLRFVGIVRGELDFRFAFRHINHAVVLFDEDTPLKLIEAIKPSVLIKGADYKLDAVVGAAFVTSSGGRVVLADLIPGQSTTGMIERMDGKAKTSR